MHRSRKKKTHTTLTVSMAQKVPPDRHFIRGGSCLLTHTRTHTVLFRPAASLLLYSPTSVRHRQNTDTRPWHLFFSFSYFCYYYSFGGRPASKSNTLHHSVVCVCRRRGCARRSKVTARAMSNERQKEETLWM